MASLFRRAPHQRAPGAPALRQDMPLTADVHPLEDTRGDADGRDVAGMRVRFWGVRGSHPSAQAVGTRVGGNTTCLELRYGRHIIVFDAGSGCIPLGAALAREWGALPPGARPTLTLLFTHAHHDHLCGLPFFAPLFLPDAELHLLGPDLAGLRFEEIVAGYMRSPYFPVDFHELPSRRRLRTIGDGGRLVWTAEGDGPVSWPTDRPVPRDALVVSVLHSTLHPRDGTLLFRVGAGGRSLVFATDVEVGGRDGVGEQRFIRFARGADVLVHDAQYTEDDYAGANPHRGFGHSTPAMAARIARSAEVGRLVLFHHDPAYADGDVLAQQDAARAVFPHAVAAHEGLEILMDGSEPAQI
jgi:ribonuclease BN (tRNA processing enzyme)